MNHQLQVFKFDVDSKFISYFKKLIKALKFKKSKLNFWKLIDLFETAKEKKFNLALEYYFLSKLIEFYLLVH